MSQEDLGMRKLYEFIRPWLSSREGVMFQAQEPKVARSLIDAVKDETLQACDESEVYPVCHCLDSHPGDEEKFYVSDGRLMAVCPSCLQWRLFRVEVGT